MQLDLGAELSILHPHLSGLLLISCFVRNFTPHRVGAALADFEGWQEQVDLGRCLLLTHTLKVCLDLVNEGLAGAEVRSHNKFDAVVISGQNVHKALRRLGKHYFTLEPHVLNTVVRNEAKSGQTTNH